MTAPRSCPPSYCKYSATRESLVSHCSTSWPAAALARLTCSRPANVQSPTPPGLLVQVGSGPLPSIPHSVIPPVTSTG